MDLLALRALIRRKIQEGRLPHYNITRIWSSLSDGEICTACGAILPKERLLMEGFAPPLNGAPVQLHVQCFEIWDDERRTIRT
jgi:hypothetical protein